MTNLSKQSAIFSVFQCGQLATNDEVTAVHQHVEKTSCWKLCLNVNHQFQEPLTVINPVFEILG